MGKQFIISVSREFGSGGHDIALELSKRFGLPFYDRNLLREIAVKKDVDLQNLEQYDEVPRKKLLSRKVRGFNNSPEENIAQMQFDYMKDLAKKGESFVIVGRCSESVLGEFPGLIPIFVLADMPAKIERIMNKYGVSEDDAEELIETTDKRRKRYHNYYCMVKWGDSRNYDVSINSSALGFDRTVDFLEHFIRDRLERLESES